ncbi:MAG: hypothetical protein J0M02_03225, partial [Planctomycetes bacterium]|nr:hypothetical protein [Planctomycetota bacterium]
HRHHELRQQGEAHQDTVCIRCSASGQHMPDQVLPFGRVEGQDQLMANNEVQAINYRSAYLS